MTLCRRLDRLRELPDSRELLAGFDRYDLLEPVTQAHGCFAEDADGDALLAGLGVDAVESPWAPPKIRAPSRRRN